MLSLLVLLSSINWLCDSQRLLYQSQCVFRHGARAPVYFIIPPYDELFPEMYGAKESDLTTEGILQLKAFGSHLRTKYMASGWFTGTYNFDAQLMAISTTNSRRTHQSVQSLIQGLYSDPLNQYAQIFTLPYQDDILRVDSACFNFDAEKNFQESKSATRAQQLFNETDNKQLLPLLNGWSALESYNCSQLGADCYTILSDQLRSIAFHFEDLNETIDDGGVLDTLTHYQPSLFELQQYDRYTPYTSEADNIGFELFNEIVNHLDCSYMNSVESKACSNANNQSFEQECDAGFCGIVFYSAHDSTLRSLAHQMGILKEDNVFNLPPFASSICFDSYKEEDGSKTVEMYYGHTNRSEGSEYGYEYVQEPIGEYGGDDILNCGNTLSCSLDEIVKYRDSRIPSNDGCCALEGNAKTYFDAIGCDNYEMTTKEMMNNGYPGYQLCEMYRDHCPSTACGDAEDGLIYAAALQKCVAITITETEKTDDVNEWEIVAVVFIIAFVIVLFILVYVAYVIYNDDTPKTNYSSVPASGQTPNGLETVTL